MVKYATHFLAKRLGIEQPVNSFVLLFSDHLDQRNNLCQYAEYVCIDTLKIYDMQKMSQDGFDDLQTLLVCSKKNLIDDRVVGLSKGRVTSADCRLSDRRVLLRFLRSLMTLLMKLLRWWLGYLWWMSMNNNRVIYNKLKKGLIIFTECHAPARAADVSARAVSICYSSLEGNTPNRQASIPIYR